MPEDIQMNTIQGSPLDLRRFLEGANLDSGQLFAAERALLAVRMGVLERPHPPLNSAMCIPRRFDAGAWATHTSFFTGDGFGKMAPVAGLGKDFPEVGVGDKETILPVREFGVSYGFGRKELIYSAHTGASLPMRKARMAMRAYEELVDQLALLGDANLGLKGLLSYPEIPRKVATQALANMSADEQLTFLHEMFEAVNSNTSEARSANTLVLPNAVRDKLAHKRIGGGDGNESVLAIFLRENSYCENVVTWPRLRGAGSTRKGVAHDVIGAWTPDPDLIAQQIPEPYMEMEPQMVSTRTVTNCVASIGSVEVPEPKAILLAEIPQS